MFSCYQFNSPRRRCCGGVRVLDRMDLELMGGRIISCIWLRSLEDLKVMMSEFTLEERRQIVTQEVAQTTALILACCVQDVAMVTYLLEECRAPVNQVVYFMDEETRREHFRAPVLEAVGKATPFSRGVLRTLLDHGADVNLRQVSRQFGQFFRLPLHEVCRQGMSALVPLLLEAGADLHARDSCGRTCLSYAAEVGLDVALVRQLVELGADVDAVDNEGNSPLHYAVTAEILDVLDFLLTLNPNTELVSLIGVTPFAAAVLRGFLSAAHRILDQVGDARRRLEMLELFGTVYADSGRYAKCASLWREAMTQRWKDPDEPFLKVQPQKSVADIYGIAEPQTLEQLERLTETPRVVMQLSLLVKERMLGVCPMLGLQVHRVMCRELTLGNVDTAVALLVHNLDLMTRVAQAQAVKAAWFVDFLSTMRLQAMVLRHEYAVAFLKLVRVCLTRSLTCTGLTSPTSPHRTVQAELHHCCKDCYEVKDFMRLCCQAMTLTFDHEDTATAESRTEFQHTVQAVVELDPRAFKKTLLHLCVGADFDVRVVRLLVSTSGKVSAARTLQDGDCTSAGYARPLHLALDAEGYAPLHLYARMLPEGVLLGEGLVQHFVDNGAHLCLRCQEGSVLDILQSRGMPMPSIAHQSLGCLAAIVLKRNPASLQGFQNIPRKVLAFLDEH